MARLVFLDGLEVEADILEETDTWYKVKGVKLAPGSHVRGPARLATPSGLDPGRPAGGPPSNREGHTLKPSTVVDVPVSALRWVER